MAPVYGGVDVGIGQDDERPVTAKLEQLRLERRR